ncbi:hypothetical protein ACFDTO_31550 [Microbacteriaceae bacterium 4G12]
MSPTSTVAARPTSLILASDITGRDGSNHQLRRAHARGELVRIRRGVYVEAASWHAAHPDDRYRMQVRAAALTRLAPLHVSHLSAAAMHRLPMVGMWPPVVQAITPGASGGSSKHGIVTHSRVPAAAGVLVDDVLVTTVDRTLVDVAGTASARVSVPMLDHALRLRLTTEAALRDALSDVPHGPASSRARSAVEFADPLADSPGESLSRVLIGELGFAEPELQVAFPLRGRVAIADFYWRSVRLIGEFDGRGKYERDEFTRGAEPGEVVWREKRREDELRAIGERMVRWTWDVLLAPDRLAQHLREAGVPLAR